MENSKFIGECLRRAERSRYYPSARHVLFFYFIGTIKFEFLQFVLAQVTVVAAETPETHV